MNVRSKEATSDFHEITFFCCVSPVFLLLVGERALLECFCCCCLFYECMCVCCECKYKYTHMPMLLLFAVCFFYFSWRYTKHWAYCNSLFIFFLFQLPLRLSLFSSFRLYCFYIKKYFSFNFFNILVFLCYLLCAIDVNRCGDMSSGLYRGAQMIMIYGWNSRSTPYGY